MFSRTATRAATLSHTLSSSIRLRTLSTLPNNPHIYYHPHPTHPSAYILTLLPNPNPALAIGTSPTPPSHTPFPSPSTFTENPTFLSHLHSTLAAHAWQDPGLRSQASAMASSGGSSLGSGGALFPQQIQQRERQRRKDTREGKGRTGVEASGSGGGSGPTSSQGGMGGAGRGGFIHVYDERAPPDFGRIPEPEDIFGSLEVDAEGGFVEGDGRDGKGGGEGVGEGGEGRGMGRYQSSGSYRVVTPKGVLGLSAFLREKLVERLKEVEGGGGV